MSLQYFHYWESANFDFPLALPPLSTENDWSHLCYRRGIRANENWWAQWLGEWDGEVGHPARTGIYKLYLFDTISLVWYLGNLVGFLWMFLVLEQTTNPFTLIFCKQDINYKHLIIFADLLWRFPPVFVCARSHFKALMHLRRSYLNIFPCMCAHISNYMCSAHKHVICPVTEGGPLCFQI